MADSELVKDVMFPAVQLKSNTTVDEALQELNRKNVLYGIVTDFKGRPAIVTREHLSAAKANQLVRVLSTKKPHLRFIEPYLSMDNIVQTYADDFIYNRNIMGILVQEQGELQGILLRETIEKYVSMNRIGGTPKLLYRCKKCPGPPCSGDSYYPPICPKDSKRPMERAQK